MEENKKRSAWRRHVVRPMRNAVSSMGEAFVILRGQREAVVHGCHRIMRYMPDEICLLIGGERVLSLHGSTLSCSSFSGGAVTVEGEIVSVEFKKGADR